MQALPDVGELGVGAVPVAVAGPLVEEAVGAVDQTLERDAPGRRVGVEDRRLLGRGDPVGRRPRRVFELLYVLHVQYGGHSHRRVRPDRKSVSASVESQDCRPPPPERRDACYIQTTRIAVDPPATSCLLRLRAVPRGRFLSDG